MVAPGAADAHLSRTPALEVASARVSPKVILLLFVLSGAAGLIYEVVWSRQLVIVFGNTTQAVSTILTGFFGGMAIGAWLGGRLADRVRSPLRMYGLLEIGVAIVAVVTPITFHLLHEAYRGVYPQLTATPGALGFVRFGLAVLALAPATILMGATLPSLTRYLRSAEGGLTGAFGGLYAANLIGAMLGTMAAGLLLIELIGLTGTLMVGVGCSASAGLVALGLALRGSSATDLGGSAAPADALPLRATFRPAMARPRLALVVAFISGLSSLAYQVLWVRLVSEGTGSITYVFTCILVLFLGGLAYGALLVSRRRFARFEAIPVVATCQVVVAALALIGLLLLSWAPSIPWVILATLVVLPPAIVLGVTFPASSALLADRSGETATETGSLLAINTLGAIVGTFVVPFLLVPVVGSPIALALVALANATLGAVLASRLVGSHGPRIVSFGAAIVAVAIVVAMGASLVRDPTVGRVATYGGTVLQADEDEIAPVIAASIHDSKLLFVNGTSMTGLTVDTKLMPILSLMYRPASERALVIAFGMGASYRAALIAGLRTDAVELVPSVPTMFGWYFDDAASVLADPNGRVIVADGRNHVELTDQTYDIIVVDPPPPIESAGVSVISSLEFYRAAGARLNEGGVMMQWLPINERLDELQSHLRTYAAAFSHVVIAIGPGENGIFMFGSEQPLTLDDAAIRAVLSRPGVLEDISSSDDSPATTAADWEGMIPGFTWLDSAGVRAFAGDGPLVTDDRPLPEYYALRRGFGPASQVLHSTDDLRTLDVTP